MICEGERIAKCHTAIKGYIRTWTLHGESQWRMKGKHDVQMILCPGCGLIWQIIQMEFLWPGWIKGQAVSVQGLR